MTIINVAKKNVKGNIKNYIIYLMSIIISVTIFFIFKSLEYNEAVNLALEGSVKLSVGFNAASMVLMFFSALFIWYSNDFFLKKRKKEIGLYAILGIENKKIGKILFLETFFIGIIALVVGIVLGSILSRISTILLIKIINLNVELGQVITIEAIVTTVISFISVFVVVSFISGSTIYKFDLIDLFKAENKREIEPKTSVFKSTLSIVFIISGYLVYLGAMKSPSLEISILLTLVLVVGGTFMFFSSFLIYLTKMKRKDEKKHYKGLNMIITSKLLYRIKGNAKSLALISVLSATTITAMGITISYHNNFIGDFDKSYPYSYVVVTKDKSLNEGILNILNEENNIEVIGNTNGEITDLEVSIGGGKNYVKMIPQSYFYSINNLRENKYTMNKLNRGECAYLYEYGEESKKEYKFSTVDIKGSDIKLSIKEYYKENLLNEHISIETMVVNDDDYNKIKSSGEIYNLSLYQIKSNKDLKVTDNKIEDLVDKSLLKDKNSNKMISYSSYYKNLKEQSATIGGMLFIGVFIGIVFLAATGSIIFFKQISEATEEVNRYKTLRKIGVDDKDIKISIYKEMLNVFLAPLFVGVFHSTIAISLISNAFNQNIILILIKVLTPYILIYLGYYILTAKNYYKIVNN